ncbi:hypothetical protein [Sphingobium sufflavum]|uniref:hypothetical protein n=1 Tax=Sphingobium sufflavum TaxID=1129547 RepID=UPI001F3889BB|nr:hypothetical protein [Sphingobium sufflavum]
MRVDPTVFVMGEDVRSGIYGDFGVEEFGEERVRDTPISSTPDSSARALALP